MEIKNNVLIETLNDQITNDSQFYDKLDDEYIQNKEVILGIDLGTSNSVLTVYYNKKHYIVPNIEDNSLVIPTIIIIDDVIIYDIKKLLGRNYDDPIVSEIINYASYKIINNNGVPAIEINDKIYLIEEIVGLFLRRLNNMATYYIQNELKLEYNNKIVITIPAYFNENQRQSLLDATKIVGLECMKILNEPTAAALAYGIHQNKEIDKNIVVYDLGAGTLDVSCLNINDGVFMVLAVSGNSQLGGENFTFRLMDYCIEKFNEIYKLTDYEYNIFRLRDECEKCKINLSNKLKYTIYIEQFHLDLDLNIEITRDIFEEICSDLFKACLQPIYDILYVSSIEKIDEIILVGGASLMPYLEFIIKNTLMETLVIKYIDTFTVVSIGAAIQGYMLINKDDPFFQDILLLDVTPLSLGIETADGLFNKIIERNSTIPIERTKKFKTSEDEMTDIKVNILQGEKSIADNNYKIGELSLSNIKNLSNGRTIVNVVFSIDQNNIVGIKMSEHMNADNENEIKIDLKKNRLSQTEIDKIILAHEKDELEDTSKAKIIKSYYNFFVGKQKIFYNILFEKMKDTDKELIKDEFNHCELLINEILEDNIYYDFIQSKSKLIINTKELNTYYLANIEQKIVSKIENLITKYTHLINIKNLESFVQEKFDTI